MYIFNNTVLLYVNKIIKIKNNLLRRHSPTKIKFEDDQKKLGFFKKFDQKLSTLFLIKNFFF